MFIPVKVDAPLERRPIANYALIALTVIVFFLQPSMSGALVESMVLSQESIFGYLGHMFLHGGIFHLIGNMLFLWIFGNSICAKVGNIKYPFIYLGIGIFAAITHMLFDGAPAIGASGAVSGMVGMFLVFFPLNRVTCFYWFYFFLGTVDIRSFWLILMWLGFDIWGASSNEIGIAYWAHIGGFVAGFASGLLLLQFKLVDIFYYERSLLQIFSGGGDTEGERALHKPPQMIKVAEQGSELLRIEGEIVYYACTCGEESQARTDFIGSIVRCNACLKNISIPGSD